MSESLLWFVIDHGKVVVGPVSEDEATSWYNLKRTALKKAYQHNVVLIEGVMRQPPNAEVKTPDVKPPTHNCETCGMTEKACTKRVLSGKDACCDFCVEHDAHGFRDRTVTDLYTIEEIAEMGRKK